ncbi:hypothetical protein LINPERHAP1_LOCUS30642 [Linum perenne]
MSRNKQVRLEDEFHYANGDAEVFCHCQMRASRRISRTDANPGRKFFGCPRYISKVSLGCGFFLWHDLKVSAVADKSHLLRLVDFLEKRVSELESENRDLRKCLGGLAEFRSSKTGTSGTSELDLLTKRVSHLEMSTGLGFSVKE